MCHLEYHKNPKNNKTNPTPVQEISEYAAIHPYTTD